MNFTILQAVPDDVNSLMNLMQEFYLIEHLEFNEQIIKDALDQILSDNSIGYIYLVNVDNNPAGYFIITFGFSIEFHGRDALVDEFYIRENFRGRGIGTSCLSFIEELCRTNNIRAVHLEVDRINMKAQKLYHRTGYKDHNRYLLTRWL